MAALGYTSLFVLLVDVPDADSSRDREFVSGAWTGHGDEHLVLCTHAFTIRIILHDYGFV